MMSPAGWLPRTGISCWTLCSAVEYGLPLSFLLVHDQQIQWCSCCCCSVSVMCCDTAVWLTWPVGAVTVVSSATPGFPAVVSVTVMSTALPRKCATSRPASASARCPSPHQSLSLCICSSVSVSVSVLLLVSVSVQLAGRHLAFSALTL